MRGTFSRSGVAWAEYWRVSMPSTPTSASRVPICCPTRCGWRAIGFPGATFIQADIRHVPYEEEFDIVCALDVIEHVDEDDVALGEVARAAKPGGGVVVAVTQHRWLWGLAILYALASPEVTLIGATTVMGNVDVDHTTENTLAVLELCGYADVEVARGAGRPLVRDHMPFPVVHGARGLGEAELPPRRVRHRTATPRDCWSRRRANVPARSSWSRPARSRTSRWRCRRSRHSPSC